MVLPCLNCGAKANVRCVDDRCCNREERDTVLDRPVRADFYACRPLPEDRNLHPLILAIVPEHEAMGATWHRITFFDDDHPNPDFPHGLYVQSWLRRPASDAFEFPIDQVTTA